MNRETQRKQKELEAEIPKPDLHTNTSIFPKRQNGRQTERRRGEGRGKGRARGEEEVRKKKKEGKEGKVVNERAQVKVQRRLKQEVKCGIMGEGKGT